MSFKQFFNPSAILLILYLLVLTGCSEESNPKPSLTSISPSVKAVHMPAFRLTADGNNFVNGSIIVFNLAEKTTEYISENQLSCEISHEELLQVRALLSGVEGTGSIQDVTIPVLVRNPSPGGGDSNSLEFRLIAEQAFSTTTVVAPQQTNSWDQDIAVDSNGGIHAIWSDDLTDSWMVYYSSSSDGGGSWESPINISSPGEDSYEPQIATIDGNQIYVIWSGKDEDNYKVLFSRSTDGGKTWTAPSDLTGSGAGDDLHSPDIALASAGNIYVVWDNSYSPGYDESFKYTGSSVYQVFFSYSGDSGANWTAPVNLTKTTSADGWNTKIKVDSSGNLHVVWEDQRAGKYDIYYTKSTNNGLNWTQPTPINSGNMIRSNPEIEPSNNGSIFVCWYESDSLSSRMMSKYLHKSIQKRIPGLLRDSLDTIQNSAGQMKFCKSMDSGSSWSNPVLLHTYKSSSIQKAKVRIDSAGNINLFTCDLYNQPYWAIYYSRSIDGGSTWKSFKPVYTSSFGTGIPAIDMDEYGNLYIVFAGEDPENTVRTLFGKSSQ